MSSIPTFQASIRLLTDRPAGHTLNRRQVLSPDRQWAIFDGRNGDPQIASTQTISRIHLPTGSIETLYETPTQSAFGPGVGAAACHPHENRVVFIHGVNNCNSERPYGAARRFGAIWDQASSRIGALEQRVLQRHPRLGELSGGTHAHSWSPDGNRVSFTYNDALTPDMPRTVGFSSLRLAPPAWGASAVSDQAENFIGQSASFLVCRPPTRYGILQALEECWVGNDRIAFLGTVWRSPQSDERIQEIFLAHLPSDTELRELIAEGSRSESAEQDFHSRWESMVRITRLTQLTDRKYPGIQGPRHWLVADPQRGCIFSLWRDDRGLPQVIEVDLVSGACTPLTDLEYGVAESFSYDPITERIAVVSHGSIHILSLLDKSMHRIEEVEFTDAMGRQIKEPCWHGGYVGAPHPIDANSWLINRYVQRPEGSFLQILLCTRIG
ncbi:hypothetical protein VN12_19895 [Pirellula sp. SH-Sr6A]|uniref:DUF3748 domain-containing protein n=1 Tax=Pirellula sp. SH-Sr6A TaxID=1632865 RepID=UPI00078DDE8D|nr:DUF3748 domain-containing protein [Pirellula sp. SH-Sr6A]AMV34397.1 hypothetical protein VN12_19895 [Pirellula sp. SH-Sr6A]